jgi:hypothetical protein
MPIIESLPTQHIIDMEAEALAGGVELEPTLLFLRRELARRSLLLATINNPTGVYDAQDDTPIQPEHPQDMMWQVDFHREQD